MNRQKSKSKTPPRVIPDKTESQHPRRHKGPNEEQNRILIDRHEYTGERNRNRNSGGGNGGSMMMNGVSFLSFPLLSSFQTELNRTEQNRNQSDPVQTRELGTLGVKEKKR